MKRTFFLLTSLIALQLECALQAEKKTPAPLSCDRFMGYPCSWPIGGDAAISLDFFRSLPDGSWTGNSGAYASVNLAVPIAPERYGVGFQFGGSYGLYDWNGRGSNTTGNMGALQQQGIITAGFFRREISDYGCNGGLVYDLMLNKEFGVFAANPLVGQLRGQFGYLIGRSHEVGAWATWGTPTTHEEADLIPVKFRAISQVNLYWTYYFQNKAQTTLWAGTPYRRGLMFSSGRPGNYLFGAHVQAPLTEALSIVGHGAYMGSHTGTDAQEAATYGASVSFGLNYSFGGCKAATRPYLFLADNSNFLVDTTFNQ